jgi:ribonuclease HI
MCRGVLFGPGGNRVFDYYWNLGMETNNKAEAYALLQGIHLEKQRKIQILNVVGDSKTIIRIMISGSSPHNMSLKILIDRICLLVGSMHINYFQVLRINNAKADKMVRVRPQTHGGQWSQTHSPLTMKPDPSMDPGAHEIWRVTCVDQHDACTPPRGNGQEGEV